MQISIFIRCRSCSINCFSRGGPPAILGRARFHSVRLQIVKSQIHNPTSQLLPIIRKDKGDGEGLIIEGSLEVKLLTIWRDEKAVSRKSQKRKDQKKEDAGARKGRKVAKHCVFSWFCGSGGLKSRLAKAAGAETSGEMRDEKLHAVVARSTFGSNMC